MNLTHNYEPILYSASTLPHAERHQLKCSHLIFSFPTVQLFHISSDGGEPSQKCIISLNVSNQATFFMVFIWINHVKR